MLVFVFSALKSTKNKQIGRHSLLVSC